MRRSLLLLIAFGLFLADGSHGPQVSAQEGMPPCAYYYVSPGDTEQEAEENFFVAAELESCDVSCDEQNNGPNAEPECQGYADGMGPELWRIVPSGSGYEAQGWCGCTCEIEGLSSVGD